MNKEFKQKFENGSLINELLLIYEKVLLLHANMGFLYAYCKAYENVLGVDRFIPFAEELFLNIEKIAVDFQKITGSDVSVKERNVFLPQKDKSKDAVIIKFIREDGFDG